MDQLSTNLADIPPHAVIVAVPALNEEAAIEDCLLSLMADDPFMVDVLVVVSDGGSKDRTIAIVETLRKRFANLHIQRNPLKLQSAAVNAVVSGCARSEHTVLVRCDAHAVYPNGYVRDVVASLAAQPDAASVAVPMDSKGHTGFGRAAAWIVDTKLGSGGSAHRGGTQSHWVDHAHHAGFRLPWFRKIGGYDPSFSHNEDAEYDHRLGLAGGKIWLDTDIRLDYHMRDTLPKLAKQYWNYGRGRARTILKHRMKPRLRQMIPVIHVILLILAILLAQVAPVFWAYPLFYLVVLAGVSLKGVGAISSLSGLWAGPALGAMHVAWGLGFLRQVLSGGASASRKVATT